MKALTVEAADKKQERAEYNAQRRREDEKTLIWQEPARYHVMDADTGEITEPLKWKRCSLHLKEYNGATYFELKKWYRRKGRTDWLPTKQHITFSPSQAGEILEAIAVAASKAEELSGEVVTD